MHISYAAGLLDGEGYVGIQEAGGYFQVRVKIAMTDKGLGALQEMKRTYGGHLGLDKQETHKTRKTFVWRLNGYKAGEFLKMVRPHLLVKAEATDLAMAMLDMMDSAPRHSNGQTVWTGEMVRTAAVLRARIQEANRRGPDPAQPQLPAGRPLAIFRWGELWEPDEDLFGPVPFSGRMPRSGQMISGHIYALPTPAHPTAATGGSDTPLLKTPTAQLAVNGGSQHPDKRKAGGHGPTLADEVEHLLPTPTAVEYGNNQSPSAGAAVRPSLSSLARTWNGASSSLPSADGSASSNAQHPSPPSLEAAATES